ncbi:TPA_asm: hypothetical protein vir526_00045 [Caudoviricetes sp. vir526]|jgi:hypothetical protein|nr:TPA_asm: hypothetical protein vir526_00045 [Caudoviricetes sp. vir526]
MVKVLKSLLTDGEWDPDITKVLGLVLVIVGVVGWFMGRDPAFIVGFGAAMAASGKFSSQG